MARIPIIPTGYNEKNDIIFVLVDLTVKTQRKYTIQEVEEYIKLTTDEKKHHMVKNTISIDKKARKKPFIG